jgi:hypothetical protein
LGGLTAGCCEFGWGAGNPVGSNYESTTDALEAVQRKSFRRCQRILTPLARLAWGTAKFRPAGMSLMAVRLRDALRIVMLLVFLCR